jgi:hypothetical protein
MNMEVVRVKNLLDHSLIAANQTIGPKQISKPISKREFQKWFEKGGHRMYNQDPAKSKFQILYGDGRDDEPVVEDQDELQDDQAGDNAPEGDVHTTSGPTGFFEAPSDDEQFKLPGDDPSGDQEGQEGGSGDEQEQEDLDEQEGGENANEGGQDEQQEDGEGSGDEQEQQEEEAPGEQPAPPAPAPRRRGRNAN